MKWLIGANSTCDMVIDAPGVSSRHCQISRSGREVHVTDLNSTNGTWVNDQRISKTTAVGADDRLRLGMHTSLTWQQIDSLANTRVIRIGRDSDNDLVLTDEKISGHHARLLVDGNSLTVIDLESSNGTSVGTPENKVTRKTVSATDTVYFATHKFRVGDLLQRPEGAGTTNIWLRHPAVWAVAAVVLILLISAVKFRNGTTIEITEKPDMTATAVQPAVQTQISKLGIGEQLQQALFAVVVKSTATEPGLRVGTAWAVADRKLATSGNLVLFLQQSADDFPVVLVQSVKDGKQLAVVDSRVHNLCRKHAARIEALGRQIDDLRRRFSEMTGADDDGAVDPKSDDANQPDAKAVEELTQQILQLEDEWFVSAEDMIHFDVGVLQTTELLTENPNVALKIAEGTPSRLTPATVCGAAFPHDQSIVTEPAALPLRKLPGTVNSLVQKNGDSVALVVLKCAADHVDQNWLGAPVLNSQGEVLGLYSRPTPSPNPDLPPTGEHCDIVPARRLLELLSKSE